MKKRVNIISVLLVLFTLFQTMELFAAAKVDSFEDETYEYTIPEEIIPEENIELYGHVSRNFDAETDMNEICILNEDGSKSVYFFDHSVKYTDDDGTVKDKSNKLHATKRKNYLYVNEENDIRSYFPKKITKHPVLTAIGDYEIKVGIVTDAKAKEKGQLLDDNVVFYDKAFGDNTALRYNPQFDGYKEEIILYSSAAPKQYSFEIECDGLMIQNNGGILSYIDEVSGDTIFTSEPLYIYDSSTQEKCYIETDYHIEQIKNSKYLLTISIDENFLNQEGLTYPVYIDPSIKYNDRDYIYDAPIYTARANEACGNHLVGYLGLYNANYGVGRLLIRFPELCASDSVFKNLSADEVISVTLYLYNSMRGNYVSTIKAYQFLGTRGWDESTVTWNNCSPNSLGNYQSSVTLPYTQNRYYAFDITQAAKTWVGNSMTADYRLSQGIIVLNTNEVSQDYVKCVRTSEFGPSYTPYVVVNYTSS